MRDRLEIIRRLLADDGSLWITIDELMKRREALQAKDAQRPPRTLYAWDFLMGVQDLTRQGALRFRRTGSTVFLGDEAMAAPPVTSLQELESVAWQLSSRRIDDLDALRTGNCQSSHQRSYKNSSFSRTSSGRKGPI